MKAREPWPAGKPGAKAAGAASDDELSWLGRRRELLVRAIAEMEHHERAPHLDRELMPNVPDLLAWARIELGAVDARMTRLAGEAAQAGRPARRHPVR